MPVDWNDRTQVEQALIKARNAGVSDEDFIAYAKEKRASAAGATLQARQSDIAISNQSPILTSRLAEMGGYQTQGGDVNVPRPNLDVISMIPGGGTPLAMAKVAGLSNLAVEGYNYLTAPDEQKPSLTGALLRTGFNALSAGLGGKLVQKMAPALGEGGAAIPKPTPQAIPPKLGKAPGIAIGQQLKNTVNATLNTLTPERAAKIKYLQTLEAGKPALMDVAPLIDTMKKAGSTALATGDLNEQAARNYFTNQAAALASEGEKWASMAGATGQAVQRGQLLMPLSRVEEYLTSLGKMGWKESGSSLVREAAKTIRTGFKQAESEFVTNQFGKEAADNIASFNAQISSRLAPAEAVRKFFTKAPISMVNSIRDNPEMADAVEALDKRLGTNFLKNAMAYHDKVEEVKALQASVKAGNKAAMAAYTAASAQAEALKQSSLRTARGLSRVVGALVGGTLGGPYGFLTGILGTGLGANVTGIPAQAFSAAGRAAPVVAPVLSEIERKAEGQ